jgi:hypothetical protein
VSEETKEAASRERGARLPNAGDIQAEKKAATVAGPFSVSWSFFNRSSIDIAALKRAGLYERFAKTTESDRFLVTEKNVKEAR